MVTKYPHLLKPKIMECSCNIAQIFLIYRIRCTERQALIKSQSCSCQSYIIVAICSQNVGRLNKNSCKVPVPLSCDADSLGFFHQSVSFKWYNVTRNTSNIQVGCCLRFLLEIKEACLYALQRLTVGPRLLFNMILP